MLQGKAVSGKLPTPPESTTCYCSFSHFDPQDKVVSQFHYRLTDQLQITTSASAKADQHVASNWTATWHYPQGPSEEPVHAFPNAQLNSSALPIQLASLSNLNVDVQWSYSTGNVTNTGGLDESAMTAIGLNANVAVDMFLSSDQTKASNTTAASHEVMVWLGQFGLATQPLGFGDGAADSIQVGGTT